MVEIGNNLELIAPKYRQFLDTTRMAVIDAGVLLHQVPGGMQTNLVANLREANALHRINEVYDDQTMPDAYGLLWRSASLKSSLFRERPELQCPQPLIPGFR